MPLRIKVTRGEKVVEGIVWDFRTLSTIYTVCTKEQDPDREYAEGKTFASVPDGHYIDFSMCPIYYLDWPKVPLVARGEQTLLSDHTFEWLELKAGDRINAWRE